MPVEDQASVSSRVVTQAALGAASLLPGAGVITAMENPDAAAQGLDRLRSASQARARRRGGAGVATDCVVAVQPAEEVKVSIALGVPGLAALKSLPFAGRVVRNRSRQPVGAVWGPTCCY